MQEEGCFFLPRVPSVFQHEALGSILVVRWRGIGERMDKGPDSTSGTFVDVGGGLFSSSSSSIDVPA